MNIDNDFVTTIFGAGLTALGWAVTRVFSALRGHADRLTKLEAQSPTPQALQTSISGIGARVGDLEADRKVHLTIIDQLSDTLQELHTTHRDQTKITGQIFDLLTELRLKMARVEAHLETHKGDDQ